MSVDAPGVGPTCPKCPSTSFVVAAVKPKGLDRELGLLHCEACGAVVGAAEIHDPRLDWKMIDRLLRTGEARGKAKAERKAKAEAKAKAKSKPE